MSYSFSGANIHISIISVNFHFGMARVLFTVYGLHGV